MSLILVLTISCQLILLSGVTGQPPYYYRGYPQYYPRAWPQYYPPVQPQYRPPYPRYGQYYPQPRYPVPEVGAEVAQQSLVRIPEVIYVDVSGDLLNHPVRSNPAPEPGCDSLQCYYSCRLSLQAGGHCTTGHCTCYSRDGVARASDNIWYELSHTQQAEVRKVEEEQERKDNKEQEISTEPNRDDNQEDTEDDDFSFGSGDNGYDEDDEDYEEEDNSWGWGR